MTLADIALANQLAHEVLGRTLDELPPQTRRVLGMIEAWVRERMQRRSTAAQRRALHAPGAASAAAA